MRARYGILLTLAAIGLGGLGLFWTNHPPATVSAARASAATALSSASERQTALPQVQHTFGAASPTPVTPERDPLDSLSSLAAQPPSPERNVSVATLVTDIARTDTAGALELGQAFRSGLDDGSLEHRLQIWTEAAPSEAVAWVKAQPASPVRDRLLARAAYVRVQQNPPEALELLQLMSPDPANEPATQAVLKLWHQRDPAGAATWLAQNSPGR